MAVGFSNTNKPLNPRGQDASPKGYNRAKLYSGKALDFDGVNDNVAVPNLSILSTSDFTICYAAKFEQSGDNWAIVQGGTGTNNAVITGRQAGNVIRFAFFGNDLDAPINETPQLNEWCWLAFTYNRTTKARKIYINGILSAEDISAANPNPVATDFQVSSYLSLSGYYNNQVSNVKVFNTALTAAQVADLYNNPEKVVPTGVDNTALKLWLPMQEGAGTTAYDGSGNGNHGTINGATYVHGIGAPVSQTAVIDWNKGTNRFTYSERFDTGDWNKISTSVTANTLTAPDGQTTADSLNSTSSTEAIYQLAQVGVNSFSVYAKAGTTTSLQLASTTGFNGRGADFDLANGTAGAVYQVGSGSVTITGGTSAIESVGNGWYRCSINGLTLTAIRAVTIANNNGNLSYIWGASLEQSATAGPYVRTGATTQTSPVLLPQGLTTGRDITGVNLFENVRKQGALNLDGNSWAEVHDNASLDVTTGLSVENWIYIEDAATQGRMLSKWGSTQPNRSFQMFMNNAVVRFLIGNGSSQASLNSSTSLTQGNWHHIVSTYDGANIKIYINGSADATTAETFTIYNSNEPVLIGGYIGGANLSVNPIAQPRIYNRALTAAEVLQNYNSGKNTYK